MLRPRIIPCLLVKDKGLVKTVQFKNPKYVGDPINAVRIFNEKKVDELIVLNIDATAKNREPDYKMISHLARECGMPLCYGGGVKTVEQAQQILKLGVEKIAISSSAMENHFIVTDLAEKLGSQSVVVVLDVKKNLNNSEVWTHNGTKNSHKSPVELAKKFEMLGAGEIVINAIDSDGMMTGYDFSIIDPIREAISLPLTALGGAGSLSDISKLIKKYGIIGAAAGSLFIYKGKFKAVLISYPNQEERYM